MIYLIADSSTERLKYITEVIFKGILKTPYTLIDMSVDKWQDSALNKAIINYSSRVIDGAVRIPVTGLLAGDGINSIEPGIRLGIVPKLYPFDSEGFELDFDIFGASFFLVTEYEKYQKIATDQHGRYNEDEYFSYKNDLYKLPLVNLYAEELWTILKSKYIDLTRQESKFDYEITIDVDHPWAYLHKGFRNYAGFAKDILRFNWQNVRNRFLSLKNGLDPFDTFDWLIKACPKAKTKFFFLLSNKSKFDSKFSADNPYYHALIKNVALAGFECGIHPSYSSYLAEEIIFSEKDRLSKILGSDVTASRQHFLRYRLPDTYYALIKAGIKNDYTTALINGIGFKHAIANEFNWFDLLKNQKTELVLHPTMLMDVSLKNYLGLDAEYAFNRLLDLVEITRKVNGKFVFVWHNSNLSEYDGWKDWKGTFSELIKYLDSKVK